MRMTWLAGLVVLTGAAFGTASCGGASPADACQHACDCNKNCSAKEEAKCESDLAGTETFATKAGCESQFDDAVSCSANATCRAGEIRIQDCAAELDALTKCLDDSGFGGGGGSSGSGGSSSIGGGSNTCMTAFGHEAACMNTTPPMIAASQCTGKLLCQSKCLLVASCGAFTGEDEDGSRMFSNCISKCM